MVMVAAKMAVGCLASIEVDLMAVRLNIYWVLEAGFREYCCSRLVVRLWISIDSALEVWVLEDSSHV